jgi:hypothetical protein
MEDVRALADARLEEALRSRALEDPRAAFRGLLRELRTADPAGFTAALAYFEDTLTPAVAGGADALAGWVAYGRFLAERAGPGRLVTVDAGGRSRPYQPPPGGELILFLPEEARRLAVPLLQPEAPSAAQTATLDLLVRGRRELRRE